MLKFCSLLFAAMFGSFVTDVVWRYPTNDEITAWLVVAAVASGLLSGSCVAADDDWF